MSYQRDVETFMRAAEHYIEAVPHLDEATADQANLYMNLVEEEFQELKQAYTDGNLVEIADGGADLVWVVMGLLSSLGIKFDGVWEEVRASNMSKVSESGKILKREDGKILKPASYFKPNIENVLIEQGLEL